MIPLTSDNSREANNNQVNSLARDFRSKERTQIFKDDAGTRRVLLGKGADDFYGLKVSQEDVDVYSAADNELVFNSNQNVFKVVAQGTTSVTYTANDTVYTSVVPHGQSNIPIVNAYFANSGARVSIPYYILGAGGGGGYFIAAGIWAAVDATNITFVFANGNVLPLPGVADFKYYIMVESAN